MLKSIENEVWVVVIDQDYYPDPRYFSTKEKAENHYKEILEEQDTDSESINFNGVFVSKIDKGSFDEDYDLDLDFWE